MKINLATGLNVLCALGIALGTVSTPAFATERGDVRKDARGTRQTGREDARDAKQECREGDEKSNSKCRKDKRTSKQESREESRDIKY